MNQLNHKKSFPIPEIVSVLLALLIGVSLFLALHNDFDTDIGHFSMGSPLFIVMAVGCGAAVVFSLGAAFYAKKNKLGYPAPLSEGWASAIVPSAAALSVLILFAVELSALVRFGGFSKAEMGSFICLPAIAAFFLLGVIPSFRGTKLHGGVGIPACLSVNLLLFAGYFDFTLPLNSPIRNLLVIMEAAFLVFLLVSVGCVFGKKAPAVCYFAKCAAVSLMCGISMGVLLAAWLVPQNVPDGVSALRCAVCLFSGAAALFQPFEYSVSEEAKTNGEDADENSSEE